jgi:hypothetical protein
MIASISEREKYGLLLLAIGIISTITLFLFLEW